MIRRLLLAYYNRFAGCPIRPTRLARFAKWLRFWVRDHTLDAAMVTLGLMWVYCVIVGMP